MTMRLIEKPAFVDCDGVSKTFHYTVKGSRSEDVSRNFFLLSTSDVIASTWGTLYRNRPLSRQTAFDTFDFDVTYTRTPQDAGTYSVDFDTTGGTVLMTYSKESIKRYSSSTSEDGSAAASAIPKHFGAIGVDRVGDIKGTEVTIPVLKFNVTFNHAIGVLSPAYMKYLHDLTGKVNSTKFLGFAAGEILFLGARGSANSGGETQINYSFAASPNASGLTIGEVASVDKKGWEYLWITFTGAVSANNKSSKPEFVYIERLYDTTDIAGNLGFG